MNKIGFKKVESSSKKDYTPESIFRDLRDRDPQIRHLWSHQADILRQYHENFTKQSDISLELPTGAGKTLIGLLLGLYRMKTNGEKVLYLCPTKQLAYQVQSHSKKYGIPAYVFVGKQKNYPRKEFSQYLTNEAIAISTYSALFNIKPRFDNADIIIFDDAHASEGYISSMWSLEINRFDHRDIFFKIISLFEDKIPKYLIRTINNENPGIRDHRTVDMIPDIFYSDRIESIREILEENIEEGSNLFFQWRSLQKNLESCNIFLSWYEILIRPWIPPTLTHNPFSTAKQRVYMSATLGSGGELERIIGVPKISRLPIPVGWDKQGSGRRFFIFPDFSFDKTEYLPWLSKNIDSFERSLVLCPNNQSVSEFEKIMKFTKNTKTIIKAQDIENNLDPFVKNKDNILLLSNRYDGLDLPGETCRHLVLYDLPLAINIQERFLHDRLGISSLLKDRIVTRITQAVGRTTRGDSDFSLVTMLGSKLLDFCANKSNNSEMHPELQAELEFGISHSNVDKITHLSELIDLFFKQGDEWKGAEDNIIQIREELEKQIDKQTEILFKIVEDEVGYQYEIWRNNFEGALKHSRNIIDNLSSGKFKGYMGLWYYFAGNLSKKIGDIKSDKEYEKSSIEFYVKATKCAKTVSWFSEFLSTIEQPELDEEIDNFSAYSVEKIQDNLSSWGSIGKSFEKKIDENKNLINSDNPTQFELGLTELGNMLGFNACRPNEKSDPDSLWRLGDHFVIIFEAKSDKDKGGFISVDNCRQSSGHYNWANNDDFCSDLEKKIVVITSPCKFIKNEAISHADNLYHINVEHMREIFDMMSGIYRRIRAQLINYDNETVRQMIFSELKEKKIDPDSLLKEFKNNPVSELPVIE